VRENAETIKSGPANNLAGSRWSTGSETADALRLLSRGIFYYRQGKGVTQVDFQDSADYQGFNDLQIPKGLILRIDGQFGADDG
jgi:hypothetical protein